MRNADITDPSSGASRMDRLHHGLLRANTFEHRVRADPPGQRFDAGHPLFAALGDNIGSAEFKGELLTRLVTAHRDDPLGTHLLRGENAKQTDCAVTHDNDGRARLYVGRVSREPACAENVGGRKKAWE